MRHRLRFVLVLILLGGIAPAQAERAPEADAVAALDGLVERLVVEGRWDLAERVVEPAIGIAEALGDLPAAIRLAIRRVENLVDRASQRVVGFDEALAAAEESLARAEAVDDPRLVAAAAEQLGRALYHRKLWTGVGEWEPVADLYSRALAESSRSGDAPAIAQATFHVGVMAERLGRPEQGLEAFRRSLELATAAGDDRIRAYALRHLAYSDPSLSREQALAYHLEALELRDRVGHGIGRLYGHVSVASAQLDLGRIDGAEAHVDEACALAEALDTPRGRIACHLSLGRVALARGDRSRAAFECRGARELAEALGVDRNVSAAERCLDDVAAADRP